LRIRSIKAIAGIGAIAVVCLLFCGCAVTRMDHMATTNWVDRHVVPDNRALQWALLPVWIPACTVTLAVDNFIIAPAVSLPSAYLDTLDYLKTGTGDYYTEMGILPLRVILTPIVFIFGWLGRGLFVLEPRKDAALDWPQWGRQWVRDREGRLLGPPDKFDPVTKKQRLQIEELELPDEEPQGAK
jgi:hypothetical protein